MKLELSGSEGGSGSEPNDAHSDVGEATTGVKA